MAGRVVFRDSQGRDRTVELSQVEAMFIGRGLDCAIRTDDAMVSRKHSQVTFEHGRFVVEDLGSSNGTLVNSARIKRHVLSHNDVVQCGSLWLRFLDDGAVAAPAGPAAASPPPKKAGTMRLDAAELPGARPAPAPTVQPPMGMPIGGSAPPAAVAGPYGAPPAMPQPMGQVAPAVAPGPYGAPPAMPVAPRGFVGVGAPAAPAALPYGGPPAMPAHGPAPMGSPAAPAAPASPAASQLPAPMGMGPSGASASVIVDQAAVLSPPSASMVGLGLAVDPEKQAAELAALRAELDKLTAAHERELIDGRRLRAEASGLRDRLEEQRAQIKDRDEQVAAHGRAAEELREELRDTRAELGTLRSQLAEIGEQVAARERQLARAADDVARLKEEHDDKNRQIMELSRSKDDGWKKLNDNLGEIDRLREVIGEQERMLDERRVGLISQEEVIKELRAEKERSLKAVASLRAERDEVAAAASRAASQIQVLEEENKRLGRLMAEAGGGASGGPADRDAVLRLTEDLKDARVALRRAEADRERLASQLERDGADRERAERDVARLEIELSEALAAKATAESGRAVALEAGARAEVARQKAADEALAAARAAQDASTGGDDARRELDRLRRKVTELEAKLARPAAEADAGGELRAALERRAVAAEGRAADAERALKSTRAELDAARAAELGARAEAARARAGHTANDDSLATDLAALGDVTGTTGAAPADAAAIAEVRRAVLDAYESVNDALSALRDHVVLLHGELPGLQAADAATKQAVADAVEGLVDGVETAKGSLRALRDVAEP